MWRHYHDTLRKQARRDVPGHLKAKLDPDDLVQEALLNVHQAEATFHGRTESEVMEYLRQALASALAEVIRSYDRVKRRVSSERFLDAGHNSPTSPPSQCLIADQTSPTARVRRNEQSMHLAAALAELPPNQREAVDLHHLQGLSFDETAEQMGLATAASAAGLVRRGLKRLRERLVEPIT